MDTIKNRNGQITFEIVADLLKNFDKLKLKERQLEFEISNYKPVDVSSEEVIETMTFRHSEGHVKGGEPSDRTAAIALSYADKRCFINMKQKQVLEEELSVLRTQIERIEFYISIIDPKYASVLRDLYIEGHTFEETAIKENISITAVKNSRRAGIEKLVEMFRAVSE